MGLSATELRLSLLYPFLIPLIPIFVPVFYIYKKFVIILAKLLKPNLHKMIDGMSTLFIEDFATRTVPKCSIVASLLLDKKITIETVRSVFQDAILQARCENGKKDKLRFRELRQYQVPFMGYTFWADEEDFKVEEHISESPEQWEKLLLEELHQNLVNKPFSPKKSPWEIVVLRNFKEDNNSLGKSLILARFHHSMLDGRCLIEIAKCLNGNKKMERARHLMKKRVPETSILFQPKALLSFCFYIFNGIRLIIKHWNHPLKKSSPTASSLIKISEKIPMKDIEQIKARYGVNTSSVITTVIASALAKTKPGMENLPCGYVLPKADHSSKFLTNRMDAGLLVLPLETSSSESLQASNKQFRKMGQVSTGIGLHFEVFSKSVYNLVDPLRKYLVGDFLTVVPVGITNVPISDEILSAFGYNFEEITCSAGNLTGGMGLAFCVMSYGGYLRIVTVADEGILTKAELDLFSKQISQEFIEL